MKLPKIKGPKSILKFIKSFGKFLFSLTLIPYGIATYKELRTVDWMTYSQTIKVTFFVIMFSVVTAICVDGVDQLITQLLKLVKVF